jgi:hypothetical protein
VCNREYNELWVCEFGESVGDKELGGEEIKSAAYLKNEVLNKEAQVHNNGSNIRGGGLGEYRGIV